MLQENTLAVLMLYAIRQRERDTAVLAKRDIMEMERNVNQVSEEIYFKRHFKTKRKRDVTRNRSDENG